jgi:cytidine deaminase
VAILSAAKFNLLRIEIVNQPEPPAAMDLAAAAQLLARAREARRNAYVPYSRFPVGAALLTDDGQVFTGCNVENASYSLTNCAERVAIQKAVSEGHRRFRAIAVTGPEDDVACAPCGSCRQVLHEFGPALLVVTPGVDPGAPAVTPLGALLPGAFGPEHLGPEHLGPGRFGHSAPTHGSGNDA